MSAFDYSRPRTEPIKRDAAFLDSVRDAAKFTPGPWFWSGTELRTRAAVGRTPQPRGWLVPISATERSNPAHGDNVANRALIQAAWQMYDALSSVAHQGHRIDSYAMQKVLRALAAAMPAPTAPDASERGYNNRHED